MHEGSVVLFAGGGTGGHLYPALNIANALRCRRPNVRVVFMGATRGLKQLILLKRAEDTFRCPVVGRDGGYGGEFGGTFLPLLTPLWEQAGLCRGCRRGP